MAALNARKDAENNRALCSFCVLLRCLRVLRLLVFATSRKSGLSIGTLGMTILALASGAGAQQITSAGQPARLSVRAAGERTVRITLSPVTYQRAFPFSPAVADRRYPDPTISLTVLRAPVRRRVGQLDVEVRPDPLTVAVTTPDGKPVQRLTFEPDGKVAFKIGDAPILGLGEGGPRPTPGTPWREQPVQFDRRGTLDTMEPRWQADMYGSRNPVATLLGTSGWG